MDSTVITALYDIGRDKHGDGRSIDEYLKWFEKTLQLNVPMVIYTEEKFKNFVVEKRLNPNTHIVINPLNEIPYFKYKKQIEDIIESNNYKLKMKDSHRVECVLSLYNIIQYSKFEWIVKAIDNNYFDTDYYFWLDAGASRFFEDINYYNTWPNNYSILDKNKFNIQGNINTLRYFYNWPGDDNYIWDCNCILCGGLFGGSKEICKKISKDVNHYFEHYLNQSCVNNEQIILGILLKNNSEFFNVYMNLNGKPLPFLKDLS
jgi:hypothetical protein